MSTPDKAILGFCACCLLAGLLQHGCSKHSTDAPVQTANEHPAPDSTPGPADSKQTVTSRRHFVVNDLPAPGTAIIRISPDQKRREAIRERRKNPNTKPVKMGEDFNYFEAREGLKEELFSSSFNGGSNTLSEAEKWQLIESGDLLW